MKLISFLAFLILVRTAFTQSITGITKDEKDQPIPFVTVYVEEIHTGTTSNQDGKFKIDVNPGTYLVSFSSIGYRKITKKIDVKINNAILDVTLSRETYQIKEVVINKTGEDPAYVIMRKAIALAPYHLREVNKYQSNIYLRGTIYLDHIPKFISKHSEVQENGKTYSVKSGDVFVEESVIDVDFMAPDLYKKSVRSIRNSLPSGSSNPSNPELIIASSFYQPEVMEIISPLSPQAFLHYSFRYEGFVEEGDFFINKIRVIPKRQSQDLFDGTIYIVDGKWCLYSVDLKNTQFFGTIQIKEMFELMDSSAWLPVSYKFDVDAQVFGIKGRYRYNSSVKYNMIEINRNLAGLSVKITTPQQEKSKVDSSMYTIAEKLSKENISLREMRKIAKELKKEQKKIPDTISEKTREELTKFDVDSLANKRDSAYWNKIRSIPLSQEEITSFKEGPFGVMNKDTSKNKTDTVKKKNIWWPLTGKRFGKKNSLFTINYSGLLQPEELGFNTVDGVRYGLTSIIDIKTDSTHHLDIQPYVGYAFSRKAWMWEVKNSLFYGKNATLRLFAGKKDFDFSMNEGMTPFINSIYSLFAKDNYKKFFQSEYIGVSNDLNIAKGIRFSTEVRYDRMKELDNHTTYSFFNPYKKDYSPNVPSNQNYKSLEDHFYKSFKINAKLALQAKGINPPSLIIDYTVGFPGIWGSKSNFNKTRLTLDHSFQFRYGKKLSYRLAGEYWISNDKSWFPEFTHIKTSYIPVNITNMTNTYQLLPYYLYDTTKWKLEGHLKYTAKLLLLKRLPIISKRIWNENLYLSYLRTPDLNHYMEAGYTLGQIMAIGEAGVFVSSSDLKYKSYGIKVSIALSN